MRVDADTSTVRWRRYIDGFTVKKHILAVAVNPQGT